MRKLRRIVASVALVAMFSTLVVQATAFAGTFGDVPENAYYYSAVEELAGMGVLDASNDNYNPADALERQAAAKLVVAAADLMADMPDEATFLDVPMTLWSFESVETAYANGVVKGYAHLPGYFGPTDTVTREQFAKMVVEAFDLPEFLPESPTFPDVDPDMWSYPYVETAYFYGVVNGNPDGTFAPTANINRADGAVMISQALSPEPGCDPAVEDCGGVIMPEGGELSVSLSSMTPGVQTSIPGGATSVKVAAFDFEAGDSDVVLRNLTLKRVGVGNTDDFAKVYLYHDGMKLGNGKSVNASTNEALFNNINVPVDAGDTETIWVVVDIERGLGDAGIHAFQVTNADAVDSTADAVVGNFPVKANDFGTSTVDNGAVDVESNGTDYTRKVGEQDVEVGNFTVYVTNDEDAMLKSITLYNDDDDVVSGLTLWRGSEAVANAVQNGRYFTFDLDEPIYITKGDQISFKVRGDIEGKDGDTAQFYVRYNTDVQVEGNTFGYNLFVDGTKGTGNDSYVDEAASNAGGATQDNITTVEAGQITVAFNGPPASDVSVNSNDIVLMNFTISAQSNVDVEKMTVNIAGTNLIAADVDDIEVLCDGLVVATEGTVVIGDNVFTDSWSIAAGETQDCQVRLDVTNDASGNETITASLNDLTSTDWRFRDSDTNDQITDVIPSGTIEGNEMTVVAATLTIDVGSAPAAGNLYVKGTDGVDVVGFVFTAGNSDDVLVNSVQLTAYADDDVDFNDATDFNQASGAEDVMGAICIYEEETMTLLDNCDSLDVGTTDVTVQFDTLNWNIPAGESRTLLVTADITTTAPLSANNDNIAIAIAAAGDVDAEYGSGTSITPSVSDGNDGSPGTAPTVYQVVSDAGTVALSLPDETPDSMLVEAGESHLVTKAKFTSADEAFYVKDLRVTNSGDADEFVSVTIGYYDEMGAWTEKTRVLTNAGAEANFVALNPPIYVPKNENVIVDVTANLQTVDSGADNGNSFELGVDADTAFKAYGVDSGELVTNAGTDIVGSEMFVYESYPTVAFNASTPAGNLVPNVNTELARLDITAGAKEDLTFVNADSNELVFELSSVCDTADGNNEYFALKDSDGSLVSSATQDICTSGTLTFEFEVDTLTIPSGATKTVKVFGDTTELAVDGDSVQLWLDDSTDGIDWSINLNAGNYPHADIIFKGDLFGGALVKP